MESQETRSNASKGSRQACSGNTMNFSSSYENETRRGEVSIAYDPKLVQMMPWLAQFVPLCFANVGVPLYERVEKLMYLFRGCVAENVKTALKKPQKIVKLRKFFIDTLNFFHFGFNLTQKSFDCSGYKSLMTDLLAMYLDMEIKTAETFSEDPKQVSSRIITSLHVCLDKSVPHMIDVFLKATLVKKASHEICGPILCNLLGLERITNERVPGSLYVRYILAFKVYKRLLINESKDRSFVNQLVATKLPIPANFQNSSYFKKIFPEVPEEETDVTLFLLRTKFKIAESAKEFFKMVDGSLTPSATASTSLVPVPGPSGTKNAEIARKSTNAGTSVVKKKKVKKTKKDKGGTKKKKKINITINKTIKIQKRKKKKAKTKKEGSAASIKENKKVHHFAESVSRALTFSSVGNASSSKQLSSIDFSSSINNIFTSFTPTVSTMIESGSSPSPPASLAATSASLFSSYGSPLISTGTSTEYSTGVSSVFPATNQSVMPVMSSFSQTSSLVSSTNIPPVSHRMSFETPASRSVYSSTSSHLSVTHAIPKPVVAVPTVPQDTTIGNSLSSFSSRGPPENVCTEMTTSLAAVRISSKLQDDRGPLKTPPDSTLTSLTIESSRIGIPPVSKATQTAVFYEDPVLTSPDFTFDNSCHPLPVLSETQTESDDANSITMNDQYFPVNVNSTEANDGIQTNRANPDNALLSTNTMTDVAVQDEDALIENSDIFKKVSFNLKNYCKKNDGNSIEKEEERSVAMDCNDYDEITPPLSEELEAGSLKESMNSPEYQDTLFENAQVSEKIDFRKSHIDITLNGDFNTDHIENSDTNRDNTINALNCAITTAPIEKNCDYNHKNGMSANTGVEGIGTCGEQVKDGDIQDSVSDKRDLADDTRRVEHFCEGDIQQSFNENEPSIVDTSDLSRAKRSSDPLRAALEKSMIFDFKNFEGDGDIDNSESPICQENTKATVNVDTLPVVEDVSRFLSNVSVGNIAAVSDSIANSGNTKVLILNNSSTMDSVIGLLRMSAGSALEPNALNNYFSAQSFVNSNNCDVLPQELSNLNTGGTPISKTFATENVFNSNNLASEQNSNQHLQENVIIIQDFPNAPNYYTGIRLAEVNKNKEIITVKDTAKINMEEGRNNIIQESANVNDFIIKNDVDDNSNISGFEEKCSVYNQFQLEEQIPQDIIVEEIVEEVIEVGNEHQMEVVEIDSDEDEKKSDILKNLLKTNFMQENVHISQIQNIVPVANISATPEHIVTVVDSDKNEFTGEKEIVTFEIVNDSNSDSISCSTSTNNECFLQNNQVNTVEGDDSGEVHSTDDSLVKDICNETDTLSEASPVAALSNEAFQEKDNTNEYLGQEFGLRLEDQLNLPLNKADSTHLTENNDETEQSRQSNEINLKKRKLESSDSAKYLDKCKHKQSTDLNDDICNKKSPKVVCGTESCVRHNSDISNMLENHSNDLNEIGDGTAEHSACYKEPSVSNNGSSSCNVSRNQGYFPDHVKSSSLPQFSNMPNAVGKNPSSNIDQRKFPRNDQCAAAEEELLLPSNKSVPSVSTGRYPVTSSAYQGPVPMPIHPGFDTCSCAQCSGSAHPGPANCRNDFYSRTHPMHLGYHSSIMQQNEHIAQYNMYNKSKSDDDGFLRRIEKSLALSVQLELSNNSQDSSPVIETSPRSKDSFLPLKKRHKNLLSSDPNETESQVSNVNTNDEGISYPSTPMMSIAEVQNYSKMQALNNSPFALEYKTLPDCYEYKVVSNEYDPNNRDPFSHMRYPANMQSISHFPYPNPNIDSGIYGPGVFQFTSPDAIGVMYDRNIGQVYYPNITDHLKLHNPGSVNMPHSLSDRQHPSRRHFKTPGELKEIPLPKGSVAATSVISSGSSSRGNMNSSASRDNMTSPSRVPVASASSTITSSKTNTSTVTTKSSPFVSTSASRENAPNITSRENTSVISSSKTSSGLKESTSNLKEGTHFLSSSKTNTSESKSSSSVVSSSSRTHITSPDKTNVSSTSKGCLPTVSVSLPKVSVTISKTHIRSDSTPSTSQVIVNNTSHTQIKSPTEAYHVPLYENSNSNSKDSPEYSDVAEYKEKKSKRRKARTGYETRKRNSRQKNKRKNESPVDQLNEVNEYIPQKRRKK